MSGAELLVGLIGSFTAIVSIVGVSSIFTLK